jgi:septum site-determining protein MinC
VISSSLATRSLLESHGIKVIIGRLGLAEHKGRAIRDEAEKEEPPAPAASIAGDENTMLVRRNIRSGQTVNAPGNLLIIGNVNRGAHLEADGDIIVMGALRGTAHAGINGRTSAVIMALNLDPTQLRIADKIALVPAERNPKPNTCFQGAISGDRIVISRYGS